MLSPSEVTKPVFLSIQAQDFIEEAQKIGVRKKATRIPEHSSSGLH